MAIRQNMKGDDLEPMGEGTNPVCDEERVEPLFDQQQRLLPPGIIVPEAGLKTPTAKEKESVPLPLVVSEGRSRLSCGTVGRQVSAVVAKKDEKGGTSKKKDSRLDAGSSANTSEHRVRVVFVVVFLMNHLLFLPLSFFLREHNFSCCCYFQPISLLLVSPTLTLSLCSPPSP
eukprot:TRINITY_DN9142_c0_g1_i2.p1 TRINITY_DN9142_c0_g1~~TRINITY_DN9142_c0_g1_i2.p1  ORF type:complete len:173 (+),score=22.18 TRINITY_DN9142_c0_g1_i2:246-764(+)